MVLYMFLEKFWALVGANTDWPVNSLTMLSSHTMLMYLPTGKSQDMLCKRDPSTLFTGNSTDQVTFQVLTAETMYYILECNTM